jgi:hypothetical protein
MQPLHALMLFMSESSCLRDGSTHCNQARIVCTGVRTGSDATPIAEAVAGSWHCTNRDSRSSVFPSTNGSHPTTGAVAHCEVIFGAKIRGVTGVSSGSNSVRDRSAIAPIHPHVLNACATVLRRSGGDGVSRTGGPGKRVCGTIRGAINSEGETCGIRLDSHLDGGRRCGSRRSGGSYSRCCGRSRCR